MHSPLRNAAIALVMSFIVPATGLAAETTMQDRAAERAAARRADAAVERRIPIQPKQRPKNPSMSAMSAVPRLVRFRRTDERPSLRTLREEGARNRTSFSSSSRSAVRPRPSTSTQTHAAAPESLDILRAEVLRLVNEERAKENLNPLTYNNTLERAAQGHAEDMFSREYFSHETPEGGTFDERIHDAGYPGPCPNPGCKARIAVGENLAKGFTTPESVLKGWMDSPGHKANILSPLFKELGVGIVGTYWAQEFGGVEYLN